MTESPTISLASERDAAAISRLVTHLAEKYIAAELSDEGAKTLLRGFTPEAFGGYLTGDYRYHVARCGPEIVGVVATFEDHHLFHLFVAESHQRQGLARQLWETARIACLEAGASGNFTVNSSRYAIGLYEKLGFVASSPPVERNGVRFLPMKLTVAIP